MLNALVVSNMQIPTSRLAFLRQLREEFQVLEVNIRFALGAEQRKQGSPCAELAHFKLLADEAAVRRVKQRIYSLSLYALGEGMQSDEEHCQTCYIINGWNQ